MVEKKLTIMKALEILQKIRYYDSNGNIVCEMDEGEESFYLARAYKEYCPANITTKQFVRFLKFADKLEHLNIVNITNEKRKEETCYADNALFPLFKSKRKVYYKTSKIK